MATRLSQNTSNGATQNGHDDGSEGTIEEGELPACINLAGVERASCSFHRRIPQGETNQIPNVCTFSTMISLAALEISGRFSLDDLLQNFPSVRTALLKKYRYSFFTSAVLHGRFSRRAVSSPPTSAEVGFESRHFSPSIAPVTSRRRSSLVYRRCN
jgi:hypothetical protein